MHLLEFGQEVSSDHTVHEIAQMIIRRTTTALK